MNVNLSIARRIIAKDCEVRDAMALAVERYGFTVESEILETYRLTSNRDRAQHAVVFALLSPRANFAKNAACTGPIVRAINRGATFSEFLEIVKAFKLGMPNSRAATIADNAEFIRSIDHQGITRDVVLALRGAGQKVSAMASALYDANTEAMTFDIHMLRGLLRIAGIADFEFTAHTTITVAAYRLLETFFLEIAREFGLPPFVVQWSCWDDWGFGEHVPHYAIFGL